MAFGIFSKKNDILNGIENKDVDEVTSYINKIKNINEIFSRPDNKDEKSWNYLIHACKFGNSEIVKLLLDNGSDINNKDSDGKSSLYWASLNDDDKESPKICSLLIKKGMDVNDQAKDGRSAVHGAVIGMLNYEKNNKTLEVLLKAGGDPNIQVGEGKRSPLDVAADKSLEAVKMLLKHKANPNIENILGSTPLFAAANADTIEMASALIKAGADINHECVDYNGVTVYPLDVAIGEDNQLLVEYLVENGGKFNPDISNLEIEVQVFENQGQKDSHDELGEEGKYHYEFHFKDINSKQIKSLKSGFEDYTWDMGFAVTDFEYKEEGDLFKILFESKKYFDNEDDDWNDQDFAQNIVTRILGKEQFICSELWSMDDGFEEKDIVFIDDKRNEWSVEVGKHGGLNQILRDRKIALKAVKNDGWALENADKSLRADREVVLTAVKDVGNVLEFADKSLKADRELVLVAIKSYGVGLEHADKTLKADRELVLEAVKSDGAALEYADKTLRADRELVLEAVKSAGAALEYVDKPLRADRDLVLAAVKSDGTALQFADDSFKADRDLVLAAVKDSGYALEFADKSLKADRELVLEAINPEGSTIEFADKTLKADRDLVLEAVKNDGYALEYVDKSLRADREVVLTAVKDVGWMLEHASKKLQNDPELKKIAEG